MNKPKPEWEQMDVPKLCSKVKKTNGASSKKLTECIEALEDHLEENEQDDTAKRPAGDPDAA